MRRIASALLALATVTLCYAQPHAAVPIEMPPGTVIDHQSAESRQYIGSPSIVVAPNGDYVASHDLFGPGSTSTASAVSKVFLSHDRGVTWKQAAEMNDQFWSNLFVHGDRLYLMGTTYEYGRIVIRESRDNGAHWSKAHLLTVDTGYHTAPMPMVTRDGRLYRAFEYHPEGPWGSFQALMLSAPVDADLTDRKSWTMTPRVGFPAGDEGRTWLEGNAVIGPRGDVLDILRVDNRERAAILALHDGKLAVQQFVTMPGGAKKFTIRYDSRSKLYWSLVNPALPGEALSVSTPASVRNTLALVSSPDLQHWTPRSIVMQHADAAYFGFQYVDWQFDGDDILAVVRTSFADEAGNAHTYHDANFMLFQRIARFREAGTVALTGTPFRVAEVEDGTLMKKWTALTLADAQRAPAGVASEPIGLYGNHTTTLTTRTRTGQPEQHRDWFDVFYAVAGHARLVSGGTLTGSTTVADGELRGSGIVGGTSTQVDPGTAIHIDPGVPHQLLIDETEPFTYFVVKVHVDKVP